MFGKLEFSIFDIWPILSQIDLDHVKEIYFTGGEPMLNDDHWKLLEHLVELGNSHKISLRYNTNLTSTRYKDKSVFDFWPKFKNITLYCSLEAIGRPGECIRSGADWARIEKTINELLSLEKQYSNIKISIFCTVGLLNFWFLKDLMLWAKSMNIPINMLRLEGPDILSLESLPEDLKDLFEEHFPSFETNIGLDQENLRVLEICRENIGSSQHLFVHSVAHILMMDHIRNENLFDLLPKKLQDYAKGKILNLTR